MSEDNEEKAGAESGVDDEESDVENVEGATVGVSNFWDGHVAGCQLIDAELERVHKKVDDYEGDTEIYKVQNTFLKKLQSRVLELTALE